MKDINDIDIQLLTDYERGSLSQEQSEEVKKRLVFTTHTPEEAGNEKHDIYLCEKMSYFCGLPLNEVRELTGILYA